MTHKICISALFTLLIVACSGSNDDPAAARVNEIANAFVDGYYAQYPEEIYEVGYPEASPDHFGDQSEAALATWA